MPDGTIKQINPFSQTEVWCVEERGHKPVINNKPNTPIKIEKHEPENYCHFCESQYLNTPPEKARVFVNELGEWQKQYHISPDALFENSAEFRRMGNLFEIVTYDYWQHNYDFTMNEKNLKWQERYLSHNKGMEHIRSILAIKLRRFGIDISNLSDEEIVDKSSPFFGGSHELIIGRRHYQKNAQFTHELCSSGCLSEEEHYQYIKLTIESLVDISKDNPFVRYVSVFQNWLKPAGASFDHLHKQLVGLDEWGVQIEREISELIKNPNLYNEMAANFAIYNKLTIAENEYAIAFTEIGHRFPTIAIYSKSEHSQPFSHDDEEVRGMSNLIHAMHRAITAQTTCNEEWFYTPFDSIYPSPWHVLIKLRLNIPAGFEGNTKIYINPVSPDKLRDSIVNALVEKRNAGLISSQIRIGDEVSTSPNPLRYVKGNLLSLSGNRMTK